jgi:hypothetical protein
VLVSALTLETLERGLAALREAEAPFRMPVHPYWMRRRSLRKCARSWGMRARSVRAVLRRGLVVR